MSIALTFMFSALIIIIILIIIITIIIKSNRERVKSMRSHVGDGHLSLDCKNRTSVSNSSHAVLYYSTSTSHTVTGPLLLHRVTVYSPVLTAATHEGMARLSLANCTRGTATTWSRQRVTTKSNRHHSNVNNRKQRKHSESSNLRNARKCWDKKLGSAILKSWKNDPWSWIWSV